MKKIIQYIKNNYFALLMIVLIFAVQAIVYWATKLINAPMDKYDLTILGIDDKIPFINWFIIVYIGCYPWWYLGILVPLKYNRPKFYRCIVVSLIGYIIAGLFFIFFPTWIDRPVIENTNILNWLVNFIYSSDIPTNLFPSMHCFISWNVYVSVRGDKSVPLGIRLGYLIMAILVCMSTVFIKQHYFVDIFAGILLCEIVTLIVSKTKLHLKLMEKEVRVNDYRNV